MLSFGRFLVSLVVLFAVFCFAWCIDSPDKQPEQESPDGIVLNPGQNQVTQSSVTGHPTGSDPVKPESETRPQKESTSVWSNKGLDLSKIAIKDPYSDPLQKTDSRALPRQIPPQKLQRIEPESNTDWNANRREKTESLAFQSVLDSGSIR